MSEVLRCEITHSIERAFQEGSPKRTGPAPCLFGEHVPSYMTSSAWRTIRDRVLERDGRRCRECGKNLAEAPSWFTEVHHLVPRSEGGSDHPSNLVTLCVMCHKRITAETLFARTLVSYFSDEEFLPRDCLEAFK